MILCIDTHFLCYCGYVSHTNAMRFNYKEYVYADYESPVSSTPIATYTYTYGDSTWGDLLTAYNGVPRTYDEIGNLLTDGTWTYTWQNGRELASMSNGTTTWNYTYDANGMRTSRSNGTKTYNYVYNGSQLTQMTVGSDTLYFTYGTLGPTTVTWNGETYYYAVNAQGDVTGIFDEYGTLVVIYNWDNAWGYNRLFGFYPRYAEPPALPWLCLRFRNRLLLPPKPLL